MTKDPARIPNPPSSSLLGQVQTRTNSTVCQLGAGLNMQRNGQWVAADESLEPSVGGAVARRGGFSVEFKANLNSFGAVAFRPANPARGGNPDPGAGFRSHLMGVYLTDFVTGKSILLAEPKNCVGRIVPPTPALSPSGEREIVVGGAVPRAALGPLPQSRDWRGFGAAFIRPVCDRLSVHMDHGTGGGGSTGSPTGEKTGTARRSRRAGPTGDAGWGARWASCGGPWPG